MPKYDIIVTVWNRLGYTKRTLASLIDSGAVAGCERLIIVDNCSTEEGISQFLDDMYKDIPNVSGKVFILRRAKNDGWATAVNDAINISRAEWVLLCNNDVEFKPDAVRLSFDTIQKVNDAIEGPPSKFNHVGILGLWRHTGHGDDIVDAHPRFKTDYFVATDNSPAVAWLMYKPAMIEVGMLKENGPCMTKGGNGEDTDYVMRIKEKNYLVGSPIPDLAEHIDGY